MQNGIVYSTCGFSYNLNELFLFSKQQYWKSNCIWYLHSLFVCKPSSSSKDATGYALHR